MRYRKHKIKIKVVKFWVYDPDTRRPFKVELIIDGMMYTETFQRTEEGWHKESAYYMRTYNNEIIVTVENLSMDSDGCHESYYSGRINLSRGYRGFKFVRLHENFPRHKTPRITWD